MQRTGRKFPCEIKNVLKEIPCWGQSRFMDCRGAGPVRAGREQRESREAWFSSLEPPLAGMC